MYLNSNFKNKSALIYPDISICEDCIKDIFDKNNFRYNYPLTNCTNCGPRYSIIKDIPYDRVNTSLKEFSLCKNCQDEFENPKNRRYHAQAISCEECGPTTFLYDKNQNLISKKMICTSAYHFFAYNLYFLRNFAIKHKYKFNQ